MKLNIGIKNCENNQCDVHGIYPCVYWNIELAHDYALDDELARTDIWLGNQPQSDLRFIADTTKSQLLKTFCDEFKLNKDTILDLLYQEPIFNYSQKHTLDYYKTNITLRTVIFKDLSNLSMPPHVDNSDIIAQFIINLTNNQTGTEFYHIDSTTPYYQDSGEINKGIVFLNTLGSIHGIRNVTQDRYILYASLLKGN